MAENKKSGNTGAIVLMLLGGLLVVGSIGAAIWFAVRDDSHGGDETGENGDGGSQSQKEEVYLYQPGVEPNTVSDPMQANAIAAALGGKIATLAQLTEAQRNGAQWCRWGMVYDEDQAMFLASGPMQDHVDGCPTAGTPSVRYDLDKVDVVVYGVKPKKEAAQCSPDGKGPCALPFNDAWGKWSQYD